MTIHKKLIERAAKNGVTLDQDGETFVAILDDRDVSFHGETAKAALELAMLAKQAMADHPIRITQNADLEFEITDADDKQSLAISEDLQEAIDEAIAALEAEGEDGEDEAEGRGSIVPRKYRDEYKARGDATRCGDWFCEQVDEFVQIKEKDKNGKERWVASVEKTYALAEANGIDRTWPALNNGQQCMNARNMVRAKVVKDGKLFIPASLCGNPKGLEIEADPTWLEAKRAKKAVPPKPKAEPEAAKAE